MPQIHEGVPTATRNHIDNVVDEVELVKQHEPRGGRSFIFHQRTVERLYDLDRGPMVDEEIERLLAHVADDAEVRRFVAALLDIDTEGLEPERRSSRRSVTGSSWSRTRRSRWTCSTRARRRSRPRTSTRVASRSGEKRPSPI